MKKQSILLGALGLLAVACTDEDFNLPVVPEHDVNRIELAGQIVQATVSRANDDGFADGDNIGVYIVDYNGSQPGELLSKGNRGDNVRHTFNESAYSWTSAYDLYYKDKHTPIDVYGYYPYGSPEDVNHYKFTVLTDQHREASDGGMGDYEASDFLWGKVGGVEPSTRVIRLPLTHRMANARVTLIEGSGFKAGEWAAVDKQVLVVNTVQTAEIDLATGKVTAEGAVGKNAIVPTKRGDEWRAIVVPQTIPASTVLFRITIGGKPYTFSKSEAFEYISGKMSNFGIRVDRKSNSGDYALTLVSESITAWEDDVVSHDASSKEYVIVNSTPGCLKDSITAAHKDYRTLKNLKITGEIDARDFFFMRDEMGALSAINLKEVRIKGFEDHLEDAIPNRAFYYGNNVGKLSLSRLVLPDKLKIIGEEAFCGCKYLSGSLIIPEGVESIENAAFWDCNSLTGSLSLPSTLKRIGRVKGAINHYYGVFWQCGFAGELIIPDNVEEIGPSAFDRCKNLYGSLRLPENLKIIGERAFFFCESLTGSLEIPKGVTNIPTETFAHCGFNGNLVLHDGLSTIGTGAFAYTPFRGELRLPKDLTVISEEAFNVCDFSGTLVLPKTLVTIGNRAFAWNWRLTGTIEFAEGLETIGAGAFAQCSMLEGVVFPASLENILANNSYYEDGGAFQNCFTLGSIVCKGIYPPHVMDKAFYGVPKDNFTLEVPESAIAQYQTAAGWSDFKRIAAHRELVCRPSVACALSTQHKQTLVINAESDWEVASKPDWCEVTPSSGYKKTELTLTIKAWSETSGQREGDIVFRLKDKDYTHKCHVTQNGYIYAEDEFLTLQKATKGNNGGINIVILGDGYESKDIASGQYLKDMKEEVEHFFGIEPYTTYRDYFNVYTAFPLSTETGVGTINTIRYNRFNTTYTGGVGLRCDYDEVFAYSTGAPTVTYDNLNQTLIIIVPNSTDYGGICQMWQDGAAIAFCPKSDYGYPLDTRGVIQHEAGGHGFGKLGDEYIYHNEFIDFCKCTCCPHVWEFNIAKSWGWYDNLELTGKMHQVGWSHLIFDPRYSDIVDIFEGGYMHTRGVYRSEHNSCMNNDIPYYSTISRESIVKRIKRYAGEEYNYEEFVALDKRTAKVAARGFDMSGSRKASQSYAPVIHKGGPTKASVEKARKSRK